MQDWIRYMMDRLNDGLYSQGETPQKYFNGKELSNEDNQKESK